MADHPPTEEDLQDLIEAAQETRREFEAYDGDEYLLEGWVDDNTSRNDAIAELSDPATLSLILGPDWQGFPDAVGSRDSSMRLLHVCQRGCTPSHSAYAKRQKPKGKPGPKATDGKFIYERIMELAAKGLSNGKISLALFGTPAKRNLVAAHRNQARKKIPTRPAEQRPSNK